MEQKKSQSADLERKTTIFFQIGLICSLLISLAIFESSRKPAITENSFSINKGKYIDVEETKVIRIESPAKVKKLQLTEIRIVPDDIDPSLLDSEIIFDPEANWDTQFVFTDINEDPEPVMNEAFIPVEDRPLFNGGDPGTEFSQYIARNLIYPQIAIDNGIKGRVTIKFVVDKRGKVVDAEVVGSVHPSLDQEALRVVMSSPDWNPGKQRGKPVKVAYYFPINFKLQ